MADPVPTPLRRPRADQARLVADVVRHQIHAGGYPDGLPAEAALAAEFLVSRNAVRQALAVLKAEGLIDREPKIRTIMTVSAPPSVARKLRLSAGEPVVFIERLRYLGDLPLSLDMTYLAQDVGEAVIEHSLETNDVFALIELVTGQYLGNATLAVKAVPAEPHSAAILQVPDTAALLLLERLTHLDDGSPVDLEYIRMRGDRITLRGNLIRGE